MKYFLLLLLCYTSIYAQSSDPIRPEWVKQDSVFISTLIQMLRNDPREIARFIASQQDKGQYSSLGFGYKYYENSTSEGYVQCASQYVLYKGEVVSYWIGFKIPQQKDLIPLYRSFFSSFFKFSDDGNIEPYVWNADAVNSPIADDRFKLHVTKQGDEAISELMTPYVGITYGYIGGEAGGVIHNRQAFLKIQDKLNDTLIVALLHSINPATRLMVIEYLYRNKFKVSLPVNLLKQDIALIIKECPSVTTISGCLISETNVEEILHELENDKSSN